MKELTFDQFLQEACPILDLEWRKYRRRSARHRVDARMKKLGLLSYQDYLAHVRSSAEEAAQLPDLMRVTISRFFREQKQWWVLRDDVVPGMLATLSVPRTLRAWSAGCCGGEEPFTLAIVWLEYLLPRYPDWMLEIIATDIDDASLERSRQARYRRETMREVPGEIHDRWFSRENGHWRPNETARSLVTFENRNLLADPPPQAMDLALCRYLSFTYYKGERLQAAVRKLWEALRPGGILMVGAKEFLPPSALELFEPVEGSRVFYRRRADSHGC